MSWGHAHVSWETKSYVAGTLPVRSNREPEKATGSEGVKMAYRSPQKPSLKVKDLKRASLLPTGS